MFFLPFRIDRPFGIPWVTIGLIAVNCLVFVVTLINPMAFANAFGFRPDVTGLYTWFTSMFIHGDFLHLGGNMYFLWLFGGVIEDAVGRSRYVALYLAGGLLAALTDSAVTAAFAPQWIDIPMIGASGAIAALIGIFAVRMYHHKVSIFYFVIFYAGVFALPSLVAVGLWLVRELWYALPILAGEFTGVASWAHIGGMIFGVALSVVFGLGREAGTEDLVSQAASQAAVGDHSSAIDSYRQLIAEHPDNPDYRLRRVRQQVAAGRTDPQTAAAELKRVLHMFLGNGRRADAAAAYIEFRQRGVEMSLDRVTLATLAGGAESAGALDDATRLFYQLSTDYAKTAEGERGHFRLAHVYLAMGRADLARQTWVSFVGRYPESEWISWADEQLTSDGSGWSAPGPGAAPPTGNPSA